MSKPPGEPTNVVDLNLVESALTTYVVGRVNNILFDELDSTNTCATSLAAQGAPEGTLVLARSQSGGRGRLGRVWVSPRDAGIYMSIVLRPELNRSELPVLSLLTGVACSQAVSRTCGLDVGLKWVNDLVLGKRKLGGILVEMTSPPPASPDRKSQEPPSVIIGIGVNVRLSESAVPAELSDKMEWLERACNRVVSSSMLLAEICNCLEALYFDLRNGQKAAILQQWKDRSVTLNRYVKAESAQQSVRGIAVNISADGALIVRQDDGTEVTLYGGEVSVRLDDGVYA